MVATGLHVNGVAHRHSPLEAQLQATLNIVPAFAWYALPNGALTFVNDRTADYLGLPKDDPLRFGIVTGAAWDSHILLLHPDDREETRRIWSDCLRTGSAGEVSFRVRSSEGGYRWFLSCAEPVRDANGNLLYWIGVNLDIEERKQAEFYLAEGQRLAHTGSWAFTPSGFEHWSSELLQIHGLDPAGNPPTKEEYLALVHPEDREFVEQEIQKMLTTHRAFDFTKRIVRPDGEVRSVRCVGVPSTHGETLLGFVGTGIDVTEQQQLTQELQRREAYLAEAQRLSHTGSFGWNVSTDEHFWSDETFRIFEFAPSSKVSLQIILDRVHPQDMPSVHTTIAAANRAEGIDLEFRLLMPDGRIKYLHVVGKAERGETGSIEVIGAVMDVTARKLIEVELRRSKAHLADAQSLSRTGCVGLEGSTKRIFWSEEAARIYGYPPGTEPTPDLILQRAHPDDLALVKDALERAAQGGSDFDYEHRLLMPDGSIKHLHDLAHRFRDDAGNEEVVGAIMDITERKVAEEAIRRQEAEIRQMLDFAPQLIAVYGPGRERLYANRSALDYAGLSLNEWRQTKAPGAFTHPDDRERELAYFAGAGSNGSPGELELRIRGRDGSYRWFLVRYNAVRDHGGQILRWHVSCTDIEDRKQAEDRLRQENVALREEIDRASMFEEIVGSSPALQTVLSRISKVAPTDSTVLITGETGTGKELVARAIHRRSNRASRAFVSVNCAAIPRDLIASELFGHEKGAFTGAMQRRLGRFELAEGGTIFLDEVGELSPDTQVALLRVLQEREFERVGGAQSIRLDVRVIAATNRDLKAAVANGAFREDLYYRLNVFPLEMPPLRVRRADIPLLVEYFIDRYARKAGKNIRSVDKKTLQLLQSYPWPGNIRELQNVIERSVIFCETEVFTVDESWLSQRTLDTRSGSKLFLSDKVAATEREIIEEALRESQGRIFGPSGAAAKLGIARSTLESKIRSLNINKNRFKAASGT
jgi:PAS domain S-box-containing protein